jgi:hypothetical protein
MVPFLGDGVTRTALVLLTRHGPGAVAVVVLAVTVPTFLVRSAGPLPPPPRCR